MRWGKVVVVEYSTAIEATTITLGTTITLTTTNVLQLETNTISAYSAFCLALDNSQGRAKKNLHLDIHHKPSTNMNNNAPSSIA